MISLIKISLALCLILIGGRYPENVDLKSHGQRPYIIAAPMAFVVFFIGVCAGGMLDPSWNIMKHNLSDLGTGYRTLAAGLVFDYCCCIAGALLAVFGFGKCLFEKEINKLAGLFFMIGGAFLALVGIANAEYLSLHNITAGMFAIFMATAIILTTIIDIKQGNKYVLVASILILIFLVVQWPLVKGGLSECMAIGSATVWFFVQLYKYWKNGSLAHVVPQAASAADGAI